MSPHTLWIIYAGLKKHMVCYPNIAEWGYQTTKKTCSDGADMMLHSSQFQTREAVTGKASHS